MTLLHIVIFFLKIDVKITSSPFRFEQTYRVFHVRMLEKLQLKQRSNKTKQNTITLKKYVQFKTILIILFH